MAASSSKWTRHACVREADSAPLDHVLFASPVAVVAAFRCPTWHPSFPDSGPTRNHVFVFPRRAVWLRHDGERPFLADSSVVTLYNRGQGYSRRPASPAGDDCEWFAVEPGVLRDAIRGLDPQVDDRPTRPFRHAFGPCPDRVYLTQRLLFDRLGRDEPADPAFVEEAVLGLLSDVLLAAYAFWGGRGRRLEESSRHQETVEHVRCLLGQRLDEPLRLVAIARAVDVSVFHLCRVFHALTGTTLHAYRGRLRLRAALEHLRAGDELTTVALDLGYSSHSHFSAAFKQAFGVTPSSLRTRPARGRPPYAGAGKRSAARRISASIRPTSISRCIRKSPRNDQSG
jgi:AraC family transcriptional regulator